jgi:hypothetical protein
MPIGEQYRRHINAPEEDPLAGVNTLVRVDIDEHQVAAVTLREGMLGEDAWVIGQPADLRAHEAPVRAGAVVPAIWFAAAHGSPIFKGWDGPRERATALHLTTRDDLVRFIESLVEEWKRDGATWENQTTGDYLQALGDWLRSAHHAYANHGELMPDPPDWRFIAHALTVATVYE